MKKQDRALLENDFLKLSLQVYNLNPSQFKITDIYSYAVDFACGTEKVAEPYHRTLTHRQLELSVNALKNMKAGGERVVKPYRSNTINLSDRRRKKEVYFAKKVK